ncbi:RCC1 domain-containing protein [Hymenobacter ruber]
MLVILLMAPGRAGAQALRGTIAAGSSYSLSIHADGSLWATGRNTNGQLGTGTTASSTVWVQVGHDTDWVQVAVGTNHSLGLKANGTVYAWGVNTYGQLGDGTTTQHLVPTPVSGGGGYTQIAAGTYHSLGLKADGTATAWGYNGDGELGDGTVTNRLIPTQVSGGGLYTQLAAGTYHSLGLKADGTATAWGYNGDGALGDGTTTLRNKPTPVSGGYLYVQLAAGASHTLGLRADGTAYAWGRNITGELGDGTTTQHLVPTPVSGSDLYTQVAAGANYSLGLRADGTATAWGHNAGGALGDGTTNQRRVPTPVTGGGLYTQLAAGQYHSLGLMADGTAYAWGYNGSGELGCGNTTQRNTPTATGTALPTRSTAAGGSFGLAVRADGTLWAWGDNTYGQLGIGTEGSTINRNSPVQVGTDKDWVQVAAGAYHSMGLKADGTAYAWGDNRNGQLGDGTTTNHSVPTLVGTATDRYTQLAAGSFHSLGRRTDGTAYAWGQNSFGQLGDGTTTGRTTPTLVGAATNRFIHLAAGAYHSLGLMADGTAYAWGDNGSGRLGDETTTDHNVPMLVSGGGIYTQLVAGQYHSLGLMADGTAYAWGCNVNGQLGDGTTTDRGVPTLVGTATDHYTQLTAGGAHSLGLRADGTAYAWGRNAEGQLGDGSTANRSTPTQEATLGTSWTTLAPGPAAYFSLVRTPSGYNFASTGQNPSGQLGDGTTTSASRFDRLNPLRSLQPLPVELVSFTARRTSPTTVALAWATASEKNNAGFAVEKSTDGLAFARWGFVAGAGSSTAPHAYAFADANAPAAAYYRLAQTDANGAVTYSPVQFVPAPDAPATLVLVPNPAHGAVQALGVPAGTQLVVYNSLGQLVRPATPALDVACLPAGVYVVRAGAQATRLVVE